MAFAAVLLLAFVPCVEAWFSEDILAASPSFAKYAGKFCFDYTPNAPDIGDTIVDSDPAGTLELHVRGEVQNRTAEVGAQNEELDLYFMVFDDESKHWGLASGHLQELSCKDHLAAASHVFKLSPGLMASPFEHTYKLKIQERLRPRFWHFVFVNCGRDMVQPLSYSLHAQNPRQGFQAEFGMNEHGALPLSAFFGLLFAMVAAAARTREDVPSSLRLLVLKGESRSRPLLRLLQLSALFSAAGCCFFALSHAAFAKSGRELAVAGAVGMLCACAGKALLILLQFLVAKGMALAYAEEEQCSRAGIFASLAGVFLLSVGCEIYGEFFRDQSASLYLYESWPGLLILALNVCLLTAAWLSTWDTYWKEASGQVRAFYRLASAANGVYFASLPAMCLLASLLAPWVRSKYIERVELTARLAASALLLLCLWPSYIDAMVSARPSKGQEPLDVEESADE